MVKSKKSFKYLFFVLGALLSAVVVAIITWLSFPSDAPVKTNQTAQTTIPESSNSSAWMESSVTINKSGDFEQGFYYLNKAVEMDPLQHLGYRGWIRLRKLRDFDKALVDFNRLDSLTPGFADAPWGEDIDFLRGECYYGKKEYNRAVEYFNQSIENQGEEWSDIQSFVYLGLSEYHLENYEYAIIQFNRALVAYKNTCEAHFGLAKTYQRLGNTKQALMHAVKAEETIGYKREDVYNEFLNEIYLSQILALKKELMIKESI